MKELNSEKIMLDIQRYVETGVPYIDAVVEYAAVEGLEIELVGEIIRRSPILRSKIHGEAEKLRMVEPTKKLPI